MQPTSSGSREGAEALFSKSHENDTRIPDVDLFGGRSLNFGDSASSKATSLSRLPVRNDALGDFRISVHLFSDQPKANLDVNADHDRKGRPVGQPIGSSTTFNEVDIDFRVSGLPIQL